MFFGTYPNIKVDKRRLSLPKKIRSELLGDKVVLTSGFDDGCIFGYEENIWQETSKAELVNPIKDAQSRKTRRQMFAEASIEDLDEHGRTIIPQNLAEIAQLKEEVLIIGAGDHFEIWDTKNWEQYKQNTNI